MQSFGGRWGFTSRSYRARLKGSGMRTMVACSAIGFAIGALVFTAAAMAPSPARALSLGLLQDTRSLEGVRPTLLKLASSSKNVVAGRSARHHRRAARHPSGRGIYSTPSAPSYRYAIPRSAPATPTPGLPGPQVYKPPSLPPAYQYYTTPGRTQYCGTRYRTYNPATNTQQDYGGTPQLCR
jgi:hypothetical protein